MLKGLEAPAKKHKGEVGLSMGLERAEGWVRHRVKALLEPMWNKGGMGSAQGQGITGAHVESKSVRAMS